MSWLVHIEHERPSGMTVNMGRSRYHCPCGHVTEWSDNSISGSRRLFVDHANDCDTALWICLNACPVCGTSFSIHQDVCSCPKCTRYVCLICMESVPECDADSPCPECISGARRTHATQR